MNKLEKQEEELEKKYDDTHTDRTDVTFDIALFEYGVVRNPKTNETVFCLTAGYEDAGIEIKEHKIMIYDISLEDVQDDLKDMEASYFDFLGSNLKTELKNVNNEYLTHHIYSMNQYDGRYTAY